MIRNILLFAWAVFSTVVYGIGCIIIGLIWPFGGRWLGKMWSKHLLAFGGVKIKKIGLDNLKPGAKYIYISNHISAVDIPVLFASLPISLTFMAKKELFRLPFFGWGIWVQGHIPVDRDSARKARESIRRAANRIKEKNISLLLFPEGTRSPTGELQEFKSAAFALALEAGVDVVPVALINTQKILRKKSWRIYPGTVELRVGKPIAIRGNDQLTKKSLSDTVHAAVAALLS